MDAWPESTGEALHTSTFLGNPVGCAMALASLEILKRAETGDMVKSAGCYLESALRNMEAQGIIDVRGRGMMWGVELDRNAAALLGDILKAGLIMLADGKEGSVLSFTPPYLISKEETDFAIDTIVDILAHRN